MKLLVCDVEGTIFKAKFRIEGTDYASTMWQPLALCLGEAALEEEKETHKKWENEEYNNYLDWVNATVDIHKKYKLQAAAFQRLIDEAEYQDGVLEFFEKLDRNKYVPILVSGGFQELANRAKRELGISYGYGACEYNFDQETGCLASHSLTPCDFSGKYNYVDALFHVYDLNPNKDWLFVGDGKNDVHIAKKAPISFGINPHPDLAKIATYNVDSFHEIYKHICDEENIVFLGPDDLVVDDDQGNDERSDEEYAVLLKARDDAMLQAAREVQALENLQSKFKKIQKILRDEKKKRKTAETAKSELDSQYVQYEQDHLTKLDHIKKLENDLRVAAENARIEVVRELATAKSELEKKEHKLQQLNKEIISQNELFAVASNEIEEAQLNLEVLEEVNADLKVKNNLLKESVEGAELRKEAAEATRRKRIVALWKIHFPDFIFEPQAIAYSAKQILRDRCIIEKKLRELHESPDPRKLNRSKLHVKEVDHCGLSLTGGVAARINYKVLKGQVAKLKVTEIYKKNEKHML
jgi:phosphoserine phosphatase